MGLVPIAPKARKASFHSDDQIRCNLPFLSLRSTLSGPTPYIFRDALVRGSKSHVDLFQLREASNADDRMDRRKERRADPIRILRYDCQLPRGTNLGPCVPQHSEKLGGKSHDGQEQRGGGDAISTSSDTRAVWAEGLRGRFTQPKVPQAEPPPGAYVQIGWHPVVGTRRRRGSRRSCVEVRSAGERIWQRAGGTGAVVEALEGKRS